MSDWLRWLWLSDAGLAARIVVGVGILAVLAAVDIARKGRRATRWREYVFLTAAVAGAMAYGLANDMVTVTISPRYFVEHEKLAPDAANVRALAAVVALKATWSVGLVLGVAMLIANNPSKRRPQLPYRRLYAKLLWPFAAAASLAFLLGAAAWSGLFDGLLGVVDVADMRGIFTVWYAHLGAYLGGAIGGAAAVVSIVWQRRRLAAAARLSPPKSGTAA